MKRSVLALGASVIALALTAGPAAAEPDLAQAVDDSTAAAQVGAIAVNAPVRVASDGDSAAPGTTAAGPQRTAGSTGTAQVTSVAADVPVRVLSDGDDAAPAATGEAGASQPTQSVDDSSGSAQVGSPSVQVPVRVLSDGDDASSDATSATATGPQTVDGSTGSAQVGSPSLFAPVRVLSPDTATQGDEPGTPDDAGVAGAVGDLVGALLGNPSGGDDSSGPVSIPSTVAPTTGERPRTGGSPSPGELHRLLDRSDPDPAVALGPGGGGLQAGEIQVLGASAESLPLTGFGIVAMAAVGLWLLASGLALRLVPGGKRR
jgi:hypothetical protein